MVCKCILYPNTRSVQQESEENSRCCDHGLPIILDVCHKEFSCIVHHFRHCAESSHTLTLHQICLITCFMQNIYIRIFDLPISIHDSQLSRLAFDLRNTPEPNMAHSCVNHLRLSCCRAISQTIIRCTEMRTTLHHFSRYFYLGLTGIVASLS